MPWLVAESAEPSAKAATPETEKSNKERIAALCIIMFEIESVDRDNSQTDITLARNKIG